MNVEPPFRARGAVAMSTVHGEPAPAQRQPITQALAALCRPRGHEYAVVTDNWGDPLANVCAQCGDIMDLRDVPTTRQGATPVAGGGA